MPLEKQGASVLDGKDWISVKLGSTLIFYMESSEGYFVNHDGETSGPFRLEEVREKLHSGQFKSDDLIVAEGGSEWMSLSEVLKPDVSPETPLENEKEVAEDPSNHLKVSRGLGVASVCFLLLALLLWTVSSGVGVWAELKQSDGLDPGEIWKTRRFWNMIIIPLGILSWTAANICLVCADRSYISKGLLGILLGCLVLLLLFAVVRYLFGFPLQEWLVSTFADNIGLIYWLFFAVSWFLGCLWTGLMMIRRKNGYRIVLLLSLLVSSLWSVIILAAWGTEVLPDFLKDLIGFMNPVQEWLRDHVLFRELMFWLFGTLVSTIAWLTLAAPLVFGKSTRPEPELMPRKS
jgi:hypothetical protein|tara:strand:- start:1410 stop:2453 length:1044 start_codon:yes stop_codon:yes gene_type:complete